MLYHNVTGMKRGLALLFVIICSAGIFLIASLFLESVWSSSENFDHEEPLIYVKAQNVMTSMEPVGTTLIVSTLVVSTLVVSTVTPSHPSPNKSAQEAERTTSMARGRQRETGATISSWGLDKIADSYRDSVFFTIVRPGEFNDLRELVGSIHRWRPLASQQVPIIYIYGYKLQKREIDEIALWRNVIFQNLGTILTPAGIHAAELVLEPTSNLLLTVLDEKKTLEGDDLRCSLMSRIVEMHGHGIFLETGHVIWENKLALIHEQLRLTGYIALRASHDDRLVLEAYMADTMAYNCFVTARWDPFSQRSCEGLTKVERSVAFFGLDESAPSDDEEGHVNSCQICIRSDAHHDWRFYKRMAVQGEGKTSKNNNNNNTNTDPNTNTINTANKTTKTKKAKVALLIPTTSRGTKEFWNLPFLSIFLPTIHKSLSTQELQKYELSFYIAYDEGDRMYEDRKNLALIIGKTRRIFAELGVPQIKMTMLRLGVSRSVTFIWNVLFAVAVAEGNDYFYQLNDDVRFVARGWLTTFVTHLQRHQKGFGVVGPHDPAFQCHIMTQSMVSRTHWQAFGWYFPPEFRNWHCDTWISLVYAGWTKCFGTMVIWNGRYEKKGNLPRYQPCKKMEFRPLTLHYQQRLKNATNNMDPSLFEPHKSS